MTRQLLGFWCEMGRKGNQWPHPRLLVSKRLWSAETRATVVKYLRNGTVVRSDLGYSSCRFRCGIRDELMGGDNLSDGGWMWPEGLAHYVEEHDVVLMPKFVQAAEESKGQPIRGIVYDNDIVISEWKDWCKKMKESQAFSTRLLDAALRFMNR